VNLDLAMLPASRIAAKGRRKPCSTGPAADASVASIDGLENRLDTPSGYDFAAGHALQVSAGRYFTLQTPPARDNSMNRNLGASATIFALCCALLANPGPVQAGDWPQILGPDRNGKAHDERVVASFPASGPKTLWEQPVGSGFAGVAVAGQKVVVFHRIKNDSVVAALDAATGKPLWKKAFPTTYGGGVSSDDGPRCVPVIHEGSVYLFGAAGDLHCLALEDGAPRWEVNAYAEFHGDLGYFGAGSSPIVDSGKLLVNVGGRPGAGLVAFSLKNGKILWKATNEAASYSSPVAATIDGKRHVVFVTQLNVVSVDPDNGAERFRFPFGARGPTVNAANPIILGDHLFVTASYGVGAKWVQISDDKAKTVWENDDTMSSQYSTCVEKDGFLYGIDGRQDVGLARLRCFDPRTGKIQWTEEGFGMASLIRAGDRLIILKIDGQLVLAEASPQQFRKLASAAIFDTSGRDVVQALPALSGGRLCARDSRTLKCIDLRPATEK